MLFQIAFNTIQQQQLATSLHKKYLINGVLECELPSHKCSTSLYNKLGLKLNSILSPNCNIDCMIQNQAQTFLKVYF